MLDWLKRRPAPRPPDDDPPNAEFDRRELTLRGSPKFWGLLARLAVLEDCGEAEIIYRALVAYYLAVRERVRAEEAGDDEAEG